jgi:hypothetical protein
LHHYQHLGVIWSEVEGFHLQGTGEFIPYWYEGSHPGRSYEEYVKFEVRDYHRERRQRGIPRWIRKVDTANQTRQHKLAISQAVKSRDYDVVLVGLDKMFMMCKT